MKYPTALTICNIYLSPSSNVDKVTVSNLIRQLQKPFIVVGDFNARSQIWGSDICDLRGKIMEDIVDVFNLHILNSGYPTHFSIAYKTFSCIDLAMATNQIAHKLQWTRNLKC